MEDTRIAKLLAPHVTVRPLALGLADGLRALILDGRILPGSRLPAERVLAARLGLSRRTVSAAYAALHGEGYLVARRGSGTYADLPASEILTRPDERGAETPSAMIDLTVAALPAPARLDDLVHRAAIDLRALMAGSGLGPAGLAPLRAMIAERYSSRGAPTQSDEVLICSGALHAWDLLLRALVKPGDIVVIEQPTYPAVIDAALAHRARLMPLPVNRDGWDLSALARGHDAVLVHVTFDGQNPTGHWAGDTTRRDVIAAFRRQSVIVVDETMRDYYHLSDPPEVRATPFASAHRGPTVVAIGSMSKSFWAGLRVGWVRGPVSLIRRLAAVRAGQDLAPPVLDQLVSLWLLRDADTVLAQRRATVARRRRALLDALAANAPGWAVADPQGGLHAWVELGDRSSTQLSRVARRHGVRITPGPRFTIHGSHDRFIRIPFVLTPEQLEDAVRRLVAAADHLPRARQRSRQSAEHSWTA